ncbi:hypothetical protein DERF_008650 [Dermatophagoides farinae]|uniref:Uncharacterized protein n=1 Tax=Dermatophagoides farinae TaxID=6954 RepID=A0A922I2S2_DERFA|nr:hypothetical protein DERF_008650 [Dermatophagoides farinae]
MIKNQTYCKEFVIVTILIFTCIATWCSCLIIIHFIIEILSDRCGYMHVNKTSGSGKEINNRRIFCLLMFQFPNIEVNTNAAFQIPMILIF